MALRTHVNFQMMVKSPCFLSLFFFFFPGACSSQRGVLPDDFAQVSAFGDDDRIRQEVAYLIVRRARVIRALEALSSGPWPIKEDKPSGRCTSPSPTTVVIDNVQKAPATPSIQTHGPLVLTRTEKGRAHWTLGWDFSNAPGVQVRCLDGNTIGPPQGGWNGLVSQFRLDAQFHVESQTRNTSTQYVATGGETYRALWQSQCRWQGGNRAGASQFRSLDCAEEGHLEQKTSGDWVSARDVDIAYASTQNARYDIWWSNGGKTLTATLSGGSLKATSQRYGVALTLAVEAITFSNLQASCQPSQGALSGTITDGPSGNSRPFRVVVEGVGKAAIAFDGAPATAFDELAEADVAHCFSL